MGVGLDWVGVILEKLLNKNLEEICREFVFDPLGMNDTSFDPDFLGKIDWQRCTLWIMEILFIQLVFLMTLFSHFLGWRWNSF